MDTFSDHSDQSTVPMSGIVYPSWPELPPDMEDFQLCNSLGSGATGTVYRTVQTKEYAVKVIPWNPANLRESARREYEVAKLFSDCETIVHTIAWYEYNSSSFILQKWVNRLSIISSVTRAVCVSFYRLCWMYPIPWPVFIPKVTFILT